MDDRATDRITDDGIPARAGVVSMACWTVSSGKYFDSSFLR
jgi:hypothetical protein